MRALLANAGCPPIYPRPGPEKPVTHPTGMTLMQNTLFNQLPAGLGQALENRGFSELTPIQTAVLNPELEGRDLRLSSQTGSGKTVALGLVVAGEVAEAQSLKKSRAAQARPSVLLVAPTRELAVQLAAELSWLFAPLGAVVVSLTGGTSLGLDFQQLKRRPTVLVGTPGRLRDHLDRGSVSLDRVSVVALDEADEMLAMGFEEEVSAIMAATPEDRRTHLVSATFPRSVRFVADRHQKNPVMVAGTAPGKSNSDIEFHTMLVHPKQKLSALINILLMAPEDKTLIFVRTRMDTTELSDTLSELGFNARPLSGDLSQNLRSATLSAFRRGQTPILVATDVAARGLDVQDIAQVIHLHLPENAEMLTHRSGRTGRAGRKGKSIVFVPPQAIRRMDSLLHRAGIKAVRSEIPSPKAIRRIADARLLEEFSREQSDNSAGLQQYRHLAEKLLEDRDPVEVVAGLLAQSPHGGPCEARMVEAPAARAPRAQRSRNPRDRRPASGTYSRFQVSWGKHHGAEPGRLLAMVCRRGGISSSEVGAITIGGRSSMVEVDSKYASAFARSTRRPDPRDPMIKFREWRN